MTAILSVSTHGTTRLQRSASSAEGPAGSYALDLAGGVRIWIDPLDPESIETIERFPDVPGGDAVLAGLVGEVTTADGDTPVELELTSVWAHVARLGFLLWCEQSAPWPVNQLDLDIEIGLQAFRVAEYLDGDLAFDRLVPAIERLLELAEVEPPGPVVQEALQLVATEFVDELTEEQRQRLAEALSLAAAQTALLVSLEDARESLRRTDFALAAGFESPTESVHSRRFSVDWRLVPRNVLSVDEHTVTATLGADSVLRVRVAGLSPTQPNRIRSSSLMFRLLDGDPAGAPLAAPLVLHHVTGDYLGEIAFRGDLDGVVVDVFSVLSGREPVDEPVRSRLAGQRQATLGLFWERFPSDDLVARADVAMRAWRDAEAAYTSALLLAGDARGSGDRSRITVIRSRIAALDQVRFDEDAATAWADSLPALTLAEQVYFTAPAGQ